MAFENPHISISNPLERDNEIWAHCNIPGFIKDRSILLGRNQLVVQDNRQNKERVFELTILTKLSVSHRKLLLPLIIGGVMSPLTALGLYEDLLPYTMALVLLFAGIFLLYFGFSGMAVLEIETDVQKELLFVNEMREDLRSFVGFVNYLLPELKLPGPLYLYALGNSAWSGQTVSRNDVYSYLNRSGSASLHTLTSLTLRYPPHTSVVKIDPALLHSNIDVELRNREVMALRTDSISQAAIGEYSTVGSIGA